MLRTPHGALAPTTSMTRSPPIKHGSPSKLQTLLSPKIHPPSAMPHHGDDLYFLPLYFSSSTTLFSKHTIAPKFDLQCHETRHDSTRSAALGAFRVLCQHVYEGFAYCRFTSQVGDYPLEHDYCGHNTMICCRYRLIDSLVLLGSPFRCRCTDNMKWL